MKILYVGVEHALLRSGEVEESFEHANFYRSLLALPAVSVDYYNLDRMRVIGAAATSREIAERVRSTKPDVLFLFMNHDLDRDIFRAMSRETKTATIAFYADEDTDFYLRSVDWLGVFDWSVVFYPPVFEEYQRRAVSKEYNVIGMNWAANTDFWKPAVKRSGPADRTINVSFVGAAKDERRAFVKKLLHRGIAVECWGAGWPNGPVSFEKMLSVIHRSKINLNLGFGKPIIRPKSFARIFIDPSDRGYRFAPHHAVRNIKTILNRRRAQSRARPFELAAAGAFVLTNQAPLFGEPFAPGKEMVYYEGAADAAEKIRYYLAPEHDAECEAIGRAARARAIRDHSFKKRFTDILNFVFDGDPKRTGIAKVLT